jgi:ribonucleoside-diphosphate reductase alpha chain
MEIQQPFQAEISARIWATKYRFGPVEAQIEDTWQRVAGAVAAVEPVAPDAWAERFFELMSGFRFLPAGRILAGAGTGRDVTLCNCFVMGVIDDSMEGIFDALKEGALTMQRGGGVGYDFSTLRPAGTAADSSGAIASGPVSFMRIWDAMCSTMLSTGARRGAMMATLRCDHPDIELFVDAKRDATALRHFNLSVLVTDAFISAVDSDADWPLVFPSTAPPGNGTETVNRRWTGTDGEVPCRIVRRVSARALWRKIMSAAYDCAEPGVLFIDQINQENNLHDREYLTATNPCGEVPLPPYGACDLGSLNLTAFVAQPFTVDARMDLDGLARCAGVAIRLLDNVIDASRYPLAAQREQAVATRRLGLGITGLADALAMLGLSYNSKPGRECAATVMRRVCHAAYESSVELAKEKGAFPAFVPGAYLASRFVGRLPASLRERIRRQGIRNSHLLAIAPAGTISLLANNISSGIEPIFALDGERRVLEADGTHRTYPVRDFAWAEWRRLRRDEQPPAAFAEAHDIAPQAHLDMQAALQPFVDSAISKTINVAADCSREAFAQLYAMAHHAQLKGCTVFRPNPVTGAVLSAEATSFPAHCCDIEREAD